MQQQVQLKQIFGPSYFVRALAHTQLALVAIESAFRLNLVLGVFLYQWKFS